MNTNEEIEKRILEMVDESRKLGKQIPMARAQLAQAEQRLARLDVELEVLYSLKEKDNGKGEKKKDA